ncbi:hypothetical protein JTM26_36380, partial [Pseudomonas aeruginosa]|nr:hypothetical protein [Pseudomonas aeruginosa]
RVVNCLVIEAPFDDGAHNGRPIAMPQQEILGGGLGDFYPINVKAVFATWQRSGMNLRSGPGGACSPSLSYSYCSRRLGRNFFGF